MDVIFSGKPPFQSTLPRGSDELQDIYKRRPKSISIHAPSRERRRFTHSSSYYCKNFNPRSLAGATAASLACSRSCIFQSKLPRGSDYGRNTADAATAISIHAPSRERRSASASLIMVSVFQSTLPRGSDAATRLSNSLPPSISIHAPSRERLSTAWLMLTSSNFNPRSLAGATGIDIAAGDMDFISIHAPSRERLRYGKLPNVALKFQSTLPRGSDFYLPVICFLPDCISIHAPSRERRLTGALLLQDVYFNPRSLAGATRQVLFQRHPVTRFQSTLPRGSD